MFGFNIVETAIGLILVFLLMSLVCSALREALESMLKQRAYDLERGIRSLLHDKEGDGLAKELYSHPLVYGLFAGEYAPRIARTRWQRWFPSGGDLPSYIPKATFARALLDLDEQGRVQSMPMRALLRSLARGTNGDAARLRTNIEDWFEASGDRISGWYKRRTQWILFAFGLATAVAMNVDALAIAGALHQRADLRAAVVATAERFAETPPAALQRTAASANAQQPADASTTEEPADAAGAGAQAAGARGEAAWQAYRDNLSELHTLAARGLPMGWRDASRPAPFVLTDAGWRFHALGFAWWRDHGIAMLTGWLLTALAVTLGAPFWFDLLNRFMSLRSTMRPRVNEPEAEAPVVRSAPRVSAVPAEVIAGGPALVYGGAAVRPDPGLRDEPEAPDVVSDLPFEAQQWTIGDDPQDGVL